MTNSHKQKTVSALKWSLLNQLISQAAIFSIGIVLMRKIEPAQFGLLGMVTVFVGFFNVFRDFGLSSSLIQSKSISSIDKNTLFWVSLAIGIVLASILLISSNYIGAFYKEAQLAPIVQTLAVVFIIQSLTNIHNALLVKKMQFNKIFWVNTSAVVIAGITAIILAINNYGVWALIYQQIIAASITLIVLWIIAGYKPSFEFSTHILKKHLAYGAPLLGTQSINYWARNADNLLIGKFLGTAALGLYARSYAIMMLPIANISRVISSVMFPSFSQIQDDTERIKTIYLKMARVIAFVTFPMMGILFLAAEPLTLLVFGAKWSAIIPLLKIFSIIGALQSIGTLNGNIFLSQGKTKLQFKVNIITGAITAASFAIAVQYNIEIVAQVYLAVTLLIILPVWHIMGKLISLSLKEILKNIMPLVVLILILGIGGIYIETVFSDLFYTYRIVLVTIYFSIGWGVLNYFFHRKLILEIKTIVLSLIAKNGK